MGIINLAALNYLVVISNAEVVAKLNNVNIYKVTGVRIIPFKVSQVIWIYDCRMVKQPLLTLICLMMLN